jgi:hypothetical protein
MIPNTDASGNYTGWFSFVKYWKCQIYCWKRYLHSNLGKQYWGQLYLEEL